MMVVKFRVYLNQSQHPKELLGQLVLHGGSKRWQGSRMVVVSFLNQLAQRMA